jgi:hypothetical protein
MFENRVLRRMFGPKRDEVTGEWRKLHNEKLHNYTLPKISLDKEEMWAVHMVSMGEEKNCTKLDFFWGKARRKDTTRKTEEQMVVRNQNGA